MKIAIIFLFLIFVILTNCSLIGFSVTTEEQVIQIPNTYGIYKEVVVELPEEAQKDYLVYEEITVHYDISTTGYATDMAIYLSADTIADDIKGENDEKIIDVTIDPLEKNETGEAQSEILKDVLHSPKMVVGVENLTAGFPTDITEVKLYFTVKGHF